VNEHLEAGLPIARRRLLQGGAGFGLLQMLGGSARAALPPRGALRVVVLSDLNGAYGSTAYDGRVDDGVARTIALQPDLVLCTGDMVAAQRAKPLTRPELEAMWASFHVHVSDPLARAGLRFAVTPGNHDAALGTNFALDRSVYREQWLPRRPKLDFLPGSQWPFAYAFQLGEVFFASLDVTFTGPMPEPERRWLRTQLAGPAAAEARARVLFSHVPLWSFAVGREHERLADPALEQIVRDGQVDLYLSGHHHAFYPGVKDGVRYVGQGCLGAGPRPLIGTRERTPRSITLIDVERGGSLRLEGLAGPAFDTPIDRLTLPPRIVTPEATLVRDDLAGLRR
jgi:Calcineurin-like phosphoesterase